MIFILAVLVCKLELQIMPSSALHMSFFVINNNKNADNVIFYSKIVGWFYLSYINLLICIQTNTYAHATFDTNTSSKKLMAKVKHEFSGSFEMINNDIEQDFSASNGSGNDEQISVCFLF